MNAIAAPSDISDSARRRLLSIRGEPLFYARWENAFFIHYQTDPEILQRQIPFKLDLHDGRAFVSLVAFRMRDMRPRFGGPLGQLLVRPIATHNFLNVRTYVRYGDEVGIFFMREWLDNRLSILLGPSSFGLPYHFAKIDYTNAGWGGAVRARRNSLVYRAEKSADEFALSEFLLERYTAFTQSGLRKRFFRIWHEPWRQVSAAVEIIADNLIATSGDWWKSAQLIGANYSPGVDVWMGWPHRVEKFL